MWNVEFHTPSTEWTPGSAGLLPLGLFFGKTGDMKIPVKRPVLYGAAAFLLTVGIARFVSSLSPRLFQVRPAPGVHIHHYVFGIFILTAAGYLALVFKGPRATFGIALLYGLGVGLTYDEFGFWFNPPFVRGVRFDNEGLLIVGGAFVAVAILTAALRWHRSRGHAAPPPG